MIKTASKKNSRSAGGRPPVSLVIPCKAEYVFLSRLVVGAMGVQEGLDEETIADLKVVVAEACNCFLLGSVRENGAQGHEAERPSWPSLKLDFHLLPGRWEVMVSNPDKRLLPPADLCDPRSEGGLGIMIIRALVDSVKRTESQAEGTTLHLVKRLPQGLPEELPEAQT